MALNHAATHGIFLAHLVLEGRHRRAFVEQAERDLHRLWRFGFEDRERLHRPVAAIDLERGVDVFQFVRSEEPVDRFALREQAGIGCGLGDLLKDRRDVLRIARDPRLGVVQYRAWHVLAREPQREAFRPVEPVPGQRKILPHPPRQPRQIPAAADIGEKPDPRFGHGELRILGRDADIARAGKADAAAHRDAVHEGDRRLGIGEQRVVHAIFGVEERARLGPVLRTRFRQHPDIAASAEAPAFGMIDHHRLNGRVGAPRGQRCQDRLAHRCVERVQRLGPVEPDAADLAFNLGDNVRGRHILCPSPAKAGAQS